MDENRRSLKGENKIERGQLDVRARVVEQACIRKKGGLDGTRSEEVQGTRVKSTGNS